MFTHTKADEVYVVAYQEEDGLCFPLGGGSSTRPSIKAHDNAVSARRAAKHFPGAIVVKATAFEVIE